MHLIMIVLLFGGLLANTSAEMTLESGAESCFSSVRFFSLQSALFLLISHFYDC